MNIVIFHNPNCGTSRNVVKIVKDAGYTPNIIEYLEAGWSISQLKTLFSKAGITAHEALRVSKTSAEEMGLTAPEVTEQQLLAAMATNPILVNRPFVACKGQVRLCRPSGEVLSILKQWPPVPHYKEDGSLLIDADGVLVKDA
jgi:arsenate reductase|tara:strand:- start:479 stop:907 length:429 start_codon:yes stop_codon:yes gene_type:complete